VDTAPLTSLYVHVPFCASTCDFCAFYQEQPKRGDIDRYLDTVEKELQLHPPGKVSTVFWGGGTPGLLPAEDLYRLGNALRQHAGQPREWTVELAPSSVRADKLAALKDLGVTRVSLGIQSFDDHTLEALGRRHSPTQIKQAWELIQAAQFASTNLDLIFAIPGQDEARWLTDLEKAVALQPDHLSTYCLTFEEDAAMFIKLSQGKVKIDQALEAQLYRRTWETLAQHGYEQYEVSNFARPDHACQHNLITWQMGEWIGYGPSAASQWQGQRWTNPANLENWCQGIAAGQPLKEQRQALQPADLLSDALIFGLRLNTGVNPQALAQRFATPLPHSVQNLFTQLQSEGFMKTNGANFCLTDEGRLRADAVGVEILECFEV